MWISFALSLLFSFAAQATVTVKAKIHDIDYGQNGEDTFLLLTSGDVVWVRNTHQKSSLGHFELAKFSNGLMSFKINERNELLSANLITDSVDGAFDALLPDPISQEESYVPTILEGLDVAKAYFKESRYVSKESQCYNRAQVWTYEWFTKHAVNSNKTWVFFTRKYIRKFTFNWWFHVTPSVPVKDVDGIVREKMMDVKYARGPLDLKRWTDVFLKDDANCPQVKTYSDYANYPESGSCFTMRTPMFYYQPFDIETREIYGTLKSNWFEADIKQAYLEAFDEEI